MAVINNLDKQCYNIIVDDNKEKKLHFTHQYAQISKTSGVYKDNSSRKI